ncbi:hypothetical protein [Metamycoplasma auris]|uniref:hypothetical protein n=1 Tax=Metamycoplasma auris TaxID=51363 RepID=UPI0003A219AF|nr:hypothetical protein [Metamycoplasma auris]
MFKNLDEFTRAIKNKKAVAGVHSDYQIAQLILEKELKKINFKKVFGDDFKYNEDDWQDKKNQVYALYPEEVINQFEYFNNWIIDEIKKINPKRETNKPYVFYDKNDKSKAIGFDIDLDGKIDNFYEYIIPYFTLDKLIAYNPQNTDIAKKTRNNLVENATFDDIVDGKSWTETLSKLVKKYKNPNIYWTHYFLDNAMIGQFYTQDKNKNQLDKDGKWILYNLKNYRDVFNDFSNLVLETTKKSIEDTTRNKLVTDGQELVSSIIEPKRNKADIAIMYNGDALDAYYGQDNFASLPETDNISFVRPNYSYLNIDGWIISKDTNDKQADLLLENLHDNLYKDASFNVAQLETQYLKNVLETLNEKDSSKKDFYIKNLFKDSKLESPKTLEEIDKEFFKESYSSFQDAWESFNSPFILNFHHINYTPSFKNTKDFLKKWYFLDEEKTPDKKALKIFDINDTETKEKTKFRAYQPLSLELKTKMIEYYYEITNS